MWGKFRSAAWAAMILVLAAPMAGAAENAAGGGSSANASAAVPTSQRVSQLKRPSACPLLTDQMLLQAVAQASQSVVKEYGINPAETEAIRARFTKAAFLFVNEHFDVIENALWPVMEKMRSGQVESITDEQWEVFIDQVQDVSRDAFDMMVEEGRAIEPLITDEAAHAKYMKGMSEAKEQFAQSMQSMRQQISQVRERFAAKRQECDEASDAFWELYLKSFIEAYRLDQGQKTFAYSLFSQAKTRAAAYRKDHAPEIQQAKEALSALRRITVTQPADATMKTRIDQAERKLAEVNQPVMAVFQEMQKRLMDIPTKEQCASAEKAEAMEKAKLNAATQPARPK